MFHKERKKEEEEEKISLSIYHQCFPIYQEGKKKRKREMSDATGEMGCNVSFYIWTIQLTEQSITYAVVISAKKQSILFFSQRDQWRLRYYPHIPTLLLLSLFFLPPSLTRTRLTRNHGPDRLGTPRLRGPRVWRCVSPSRTMSYLLLLFWNTTTIHLRSSYLQRAWVILWLATILHWVSLLSQFLAYGPSSSALSSPRFQTSN